MARRRIEGQPPEPAYAPVEIAVVVATYNRAGKLPKVIRALQAQDLHVPFEIVVVDDGSTDATSAVLDDLAASEPRLRVRRLDQNGGPARARNLGWQSSLAPLVAFTDDDCEPGRGWLRALVESFADAEVGIVQGRTIPDPHGVLGPFSRAVHVEAENSFYETCNIAYRRSVLDAMGGFDITFDLAAGEDTDLAWRAREAGHRTRYAARALVVHDVVQSSYVAYLRNTRRWRGVVHVVRKHPHLRREFSGWPFWLPAQNRAALVLTAPIGFAIGGRHRRVGALICLATIAPWLHWRIFRQALPTSRPARALLLPAVLLVDLAEVAIHLSSLRRVAGVSPCSERTFHRAPPAGPATSR